MSSITSRLAIHSGTALIPEMEREERDRLREDIRANGQRLPILTWRGQVVDGRERLRVLRELRMEPIIEKIDPNDDPIDAMLSANIHRRHLSKAQIAMILARANRRSPEDLRAANVSARTVATAAKVHRIGTPEVVRAVEKGRVSLNLANRISELPKAEQAEVVGLASAGKVEEVSKRLAPVTRPKPERKAAVVERQPTVDGAPVSSTPTPESIVEQFRKCPDRLETIRQLIGELAEHEKGIAAGFLGITPSTPVKVETPEPVIQVEVRDRLSDEMIASPQMIGLGARLGNVATAVGVVRLLYSLTEKHAPRGNVGVMSDAAIAKGCDWSGDGEVFVSALVQEGWLVRDLDHRLLVANWDQHCPSAVREELEKTGRGFAEPTGVPQVKEKKARKVSEVKTVSEFGEAFERFWEAFPKHRRRGKQAAFRRWTTALKAIKLPEGEDAAEFIIERATAYANSDEGRGQYVPAPEVWLNKGRYLDDEAAWSEGQATVAFSPEFERFWLACPINRRADKADAWEAWCKAIKSAKGKEGETPESFLIRRMTAYAQSDQGKGQYAKRPASWLESASYNDADEAWGDKNAPGASVRVSRPIPQGFSLRPDFSKGPVTNGK